MAVVTGGTVVKIRRSHQDIMSVDMASEVRAVATDALTATGNCWRNKITIALAVTGKAPTGVMDISSADERCDGSGVAPGTIGSDRRGNAVLADLGCMVIGMTREVRSMTTGACRIRDDNFYQGSINWILQERRAGVATAAKVVMHR